MFGIKYLTFTEGISGEEVKSVLAPSVTPQTGTWEWVQHEEH